MFEKKNVNGALIGIPNSYSRNPGSVHRMSILAEILMDFHGPHRQILGQCLKIGRFHTLLTVPLTKIPPHHSL
jgi:hypothetical protein